MYKENRKKIILFAIIIVLIFIITVILRKCVIVNSDIQIKEITIDENITESTEEEKIRTVKSGVIGSNPDDIKDRYSFHNSFDDSIALNKLLWDNEMWEYLSLSDKFKEKYKKNTDIIREIDKAKSIDGFDVYDFDDDGGHIFSFYAMYDRGKLLQYNFDEAIEVIGYIINYDLNDNYELDDIEVIEAKPMTMEEFVWGLDEDAPEKDY